MTSERLATAQVDSVLSADGRRPARPTSSYDPAATQTSAAGRRLKILVRGSNFLTVCRTPGAV